MPPSVPPDAPDYERDAEDLQVLELPAHHARVGAPALRAGGAERAVRGRRRRRRAARRRRTARGRSTSAASASATAPSCAADVVVASTGRRDAVPAWFAEHGVDVPEEEHPTGTIYLSRFYRTRRGDRRADRLPGRAARRPRLRRRRRRQRHVLGDARGRRRRRRAARPPARPGPVRGRAPAVPRDGAGRAPRRRRRSRRCRRWAGSINRIRRFVDADGAPLAHGFFAIGDAHTCTNPLYGRGSSLAVLQAILVADAARRPPRRPRRRGPRLRGGQRREGRALVRRLGADRRRPRREPTGAGDAARRRRSPRRRASTWRRSAASPRRATPSWRSSSPDDEPAPHAAGGVRRPEVLERLARRRRWSGRAIRTGPACAADPGRPPRRGSLKITARR